MWGWYYSHDPGPGGTSIVTVSDPWTYKNTGEMIEIYLC